MPDDIAAFIAGLPKAELHVHLQGAASVETILELSHRYPDAGLPTDEAAMREFYTFTDFEAFIRVYMAVNRLVRTADDVATLLRGLGRDLALVNVRYAEVTVTVDSHLQQGIAPDALADALARARADVATLQGVELGFVYDINGLDGVAAGERTVAWAEQFMPEHSVGFGLGGPENGVEPRTAYADAFRRAAAIGLASVPHAGETSGPESVREAIDDLYAVRVGHGIGAAADPRLMADLAERGITLEICPTSNICTGAVARPEDHPFPVLRAAGVPVTLNTDDPGMFTTDLNREYRIGHDVFGLDAPALAELSRVALGASFAPTETKTRVRAEIDAYEAAALS